MLMRPLRSLRKTVRVEYFPINAYSLSKVGSSITSLTSPRVIRLMFLTSWSPSRNCLNLPLKSSWSIVSKWRVLIAPIWSLSFTSRIWLKEKILGSQLATVTTASPRKRVPSKTSGNLITLPFCNADYGIQPFLSWRHTSRNKMQRWNNFSITSILPEGTVSSRQPWRIRSIYKVRKADQYPTPPST